MSAYTKVRLNEGPLYIYKGKVYEIVYCIRSSSSSNKYTNVRLYEGPLIRRSAPPLVWFEYIEAW